MPHPSRDAPRVIVGAVIIGVSSAFVFVMALLFCITDVAEVETSLAGPLATIFLQASGSKTGATILMMLPMICSAVASQGKKRITSQ
jgi:choline transport protein